MMTLTILISRTILKSFRALIGVQFEMRTPILHHVFLYIKIITNYIKIIFNVNFATKGPKLIIFL